MENILRRLFDACFSLSGQRFPLISAPAIERDRSSGGMFTACVAVGVDNDVANHVVSCETSEMFLSGCLALFVG